MAIVHPVLLCGGSGTRLWPLSRKGFPKQFVPFAGASTLFQAAALRMAGNTETTAPLILASSDFRFIVAEQLTAIGIDPASILIEPEARNTAPAILAAVLHLAATDPGALVLVMPTDHEIPDVAAFRKAVATGIPRALAGKIVTFGIAPDRPETGYGWLELTAPPHDGLPQPLVRFVEKPDAARAAQMLAEGRYLWNSGIFLASVASLIAAFESHAADLLGPVSEAVKAARVDLGFLRLAVKPWAGARSVSIDFAVMEHASNLEVVPFGAGWSDLGDWNAVWRGSAQSDATNVTHGAVMQLDCEGSLLRSEAEGLHLVGIGLTDMIVVAMPDAVLVADRSRAQDVKDAVASMKANAVRQAEVFPRDHRPWGWFETLIMGDRFQVKRIVVRPGASLSLQSHIHRAEHWIVVCGTAQVTVGEDVQLLTENQSIYVPLGAVHRLANPGRVPVVLIEVQTGVYLGEDDIIRYDDLYARGQGARG